MRSLIRLVFWGVLWLVAWAVVSLIRFFKKTPRLDNCLTWSLRKWDQDGGYLVIRWARSSQYRWMRWPHFLWLDINDHENLRHFIPKKQDQGMRFIPDIWFNGKVQKGDDPEDGLEN